MGKEKLYLHEYRSCFQIIINSFEKTALAPKDEVHPEKMRLGGLALFLANFDRRIYGLGKHKKSNIHFLFLLHLAYGRTGNKIHHHHQKGHKDLIARHFTLMIKNSSLMFPSMSITGVASTNFKALLIKLVEALAVGQLFRSN